MKTFLEKVLFWRRFGIGEKKLKIILSQKTDEANLIHCDFSALEARAALEQGHIEKTILLATVYGMPKNKLRERLIELYPDWIPTHFDNLLAKYAPQRHCK